MSFRLFLKGSIQFTAVHILNQANQPDSSQTALIAKSSGETLFALWLAKHVGCHLPAACDPETTEIIRGLFSVSTSVFIIETALRGDPLAYLAANIGKVFLLTVLIGGAYAADLGINRGPQEHVYRSHAAQRLLPQIRLALLRDITYTENSLANEERLENDAPDADMNN